VTPEAEYAVEAVVQMARLVHLSDEGVRILASVLWSHADESGTGEDSPVFAFAGYVAPAESWGPFAERWVDTLRHHGLNRFHATETALRVIRISRGGRRKTVSSSWPSS
jgi:hypothetical protein